MADAAVRIVTVAPTRVAMLVHCGDPAGLDASIARFVAWRRAAGLLPHNSATFNILYGDPRTTPPAAFRTDLCVATDGAIAPNDAGIVAGLIPGGRCAVLRHVGSDDGLPDALRQLVADWLPRSGERRRDQPLYCQRVAFPPAV